MGVDQAVVFLPEKAADAGRATSPMAKAEDATEVDTTELTLEQVIECVISLVEERERPRP